MTIAVEVGGTIYNVLEKDLDGEWCLESNHATEIGALNRIEARMKEEDEENSDEYSVEEMKLQL